MTSHPKVLIAPGYCPLILACLSDEDITVRTRALDSLIGIATRKTVMDLVT
jgi:AP-3 complex subunit delta-1